MMYALNLAADNRVLSACEVLTNGNYDGMTIVEELPEGNIADYIYQNSEYIHNPLPNQEENETETADAVLNALLGVTE